MSLLPERYLMPAKYIISGATAAVINIGILTALVEYGHINYLVAEVAAFVPAFFVNFFLQRMWTFGHRGWQGVYRHMASYLVLTLANLACNVCLLYFFVHELHIFYPLAEAGAIALLAIVSFLVSRHFIFADESRWPAWSRPQLATVLGGVAIALAVFLSVYKLAESPPTWFDEGILTQVAMNVDYFGPHAQFQIAPGEFVSAAFVATTSYPLLYILAAAFSIFGVHLLVARAVMVAFILLFVICAWMLARREMTPYLAAGSALLLATFPPLYGDGKTVLGEVPGLAYLMLFLLVVKHIEKGRARWPVFLLGGALLGLVVATKPIFFLLLPAAGVVFLCSRQLLSVSKVLAVLAGFAVPMLVWVWMQFGGQTIGEVLALYANPYGANAGSSVGANASLFIHQPEPLYALLLLVAWLASILWRLYRCGSVSRAEYIAAGFAPLTYIVFLHGNGDYRYFFLGEVLALLYLPAALWHMWPRRLPRTLLCTVLTFLIVFQLYECFSHSWVAKFYNSHRTAQIEANLPNLPASKTIFIYQAPETIMFLPPHMPYYQYLLATDALVLGQQELPLIAQGTTDYVVLWSGKESDLDLSHYRKEATFDRYSLWQKK